MQMYSSSQNQVHKKVSVVITAIADKVKMRSLEVGNVQVLRFKYLFFKKILFKFLFIFKTDLMKVLYIITLHHKNG